MITFKFYNSLLFLSYCLPLLKSILFMYLFIFYLPLEWNHTLFFLFLCQSICARVLAIYKCQIWRVFKESMPRFPHRRSGKYIYLFQQIVV